MATVSSSQAASTYPKKQPTFGDVKVAWGVYEIASALSKNDVIQFFKIPAGSSVIFGWLFGDDIDTGTEALELDIGTSDDTDQFLNSGVISGDAVTEMKPEVSICMPLNGLLKDGPQTFTSDTMIQGTVVAAANAGGTGTVYLMMLYTQTPSLGT